MKRIANYLIVLAVAAFTFTSCEDIPSPFGEIVKPSSGDDVVVIEASGTGTETDPYNVTAVLEYISGLGADTPSDKDVYVKGYAVELTDISAQYGNATFTMSDNAEGTAGKFTVYRAKGLGNEAVTDPSFIKEGDEVVVCGKVTNYMGNTPETVQGQAYVYSVNGKGGGGGTTKPDEPSTGDAKGTGTQNDPYNIAGAIAKCQQIGETASSESYYVKGIVVKGGTVSGGYGNVTFTMGDTKDATDVFTAYQVAGTDGEKLADGYEVKAGDEVIVYGPMYNYKGNTPETKQGAAYIVSINSNGGDNTGGGNNGGGNNGGGSALLTNGDFETWANGLPTGWKSASTASSATLSQSTDAHGGKYSVQVAGDEGSNKRLASQEITLAAGTYTFSFYAKATTADAAQVRPGQVPITDGKAGSYAYGDYANINNSSWTLVSTEFTLNAETTVCLVVMNPKKSNYSSGKDILIDDATLTKK